MKRTLNIIGVTFALVCLCIGANAQVGIGVANPHPLSILDLTNTNNKGLMLPSLSSVPGAGADTTGLLFYYQDALYFRDTAGYNVVNPWKYKYNGSTTEAVYFNPSGYLGVGIGINGAVATNVKGNLHVSLNGKEASVTGTSAVIFVGDSDAGTHLMIDNDEIIVKTNTTTAGTLKLQEGGGTVQVGQDISNPSTLNVYGKVQEDGNDLVPAGVVVMWSGSLASIPDGWALCDGQKYSVNTSTGATQVDASGAQTPDLRERFIVGAGSSDNSTVAGTTQYAPGATAGANTVALTVAQMPSHNHGGATGGAGAHSHTVTDNYDTQNCKDGAFAGTSGCYMTKDDATSTTQTTSGVANHTHSISSEGGGAAHENRPPYYALAFIMKL